MHLWIYTVLMRFDYVIWYLALRLLTADAICSGFNSQFHFLRNLFFFYRFLTSTAIAALTSSSSASSRPCLRKWRKSSKWIYSIASITINIARSSNKSFAEFSNAKMYVRTFSFDKQVVLEVEWIMGSLFYMLPLHLNNHTFKQLARLH